MAPEWLPQRSNYSGRQSNAAVDIRLKVAHVGDDGAQVGELVNKCGIVVADIRSVATFHEFSFGPAGSETEFGGFCVEDG